jgi:hypothetical protein
MKSVQGCAELIEPGWCFFQPAAGGDGWDCPEQEVVFGPSLVERPLGWGLHPEKEPV